MDNVERPGGGTVEIERFDQPRFRCPTCRKSWASKSRCRAHITEGCWHDPTNRGCRTCKFYDAGSTGDPSIGDPGSEPYCQAGYPKNEQSEMVDPLDGATIKLDPSWFGGDEILCPGWASHKADENGVNNG